MTPPIRITPRARDDLAGIGRYTAKRWGKAQRTLYLTQLQKRFEFLAERPQLGKHRSDIQAGLYSFPQGQHLVFYLIRNRGIDIVAVLHREMDVSTYFAAD